MNTVINISRQLHKGKNLINYIPYITSRGGLTCEIQPDKRIRVYGTPTGTYTIIMSLPLDSILEDGKTYTISSGLISNLLYVQVREENKITLRSTYYFNRGVYSVSFRANLKENNYTFTIQTSNLLENFDLIIAPQLEEGTEATPFEPYKNNYLPRHLLNRRSVIFE